MNEQEQRTCQNCEHAFTIEPEDFLFYEKIAVPPPTFCPNCRLQRRVAFTNTFYLYKRNCDLCKKEVISRYSSDKEHTVYCPKCWYSDNWDPMDYGRDYDFSRPFFEQFGELMCQVPLLGLSMDVETATSSPYTNDVGHLKNCYLIFTSDFSEECAYGYYVVLSKECINSFLINSCELLSDSFHCFQIYNGIGLEYTLSSSESAFLWQSTNCQNCFASANLHNKKYHIFNKPHTKEEYEKKRASYDLGSYKAYQEVKKQFKEHKLKYPVKTFWQERSRDVSGLFVFGSKNCKRCFEIDGGENCKYASSALTGPIKECFDYTFFGNNAELVYEGLIVGQNARNIKFADESAIGIYDNSYVKLAVNGSSNLFGCVSVRKKSYCILNKQYSKKEYENLVPRIIKHMNDMPYTDKKGRVYKYGEFFPIEFSPFAYNETTAAQYYPLTKEEVEKQGYAWKDIQVNEYEVTLPADKLLDHIKDIDETILQEVIGCKTCGRAFRIVKQELLLHKKMNVPVPRNCFYCRLEERMKEQPHPLQLWKRTCQCSGEKSSNGLYTNQAAHFHNANPGRSRASDVPCPNTFETSYAEERPEIVYCKQCYQAEVL